MPLATRETQERGRQSMAEPRKIRVLVADDHQVVRVGLRAIIDAEPDMEVVAEAADGPSAVAAYADPPPGHHAAGPAHAGHERRPRHHRDPQAQSPNANIIVVTTYDADEDVFRAVQAGARGYLLKDTFTEGMLEAIRNVHAGRRLIDPAAGGAADGPGERAGR